MDYLDIRDNIGLATEKLNDIGFLMQEIQDEYFGRFDNKNEDDKFGIVWDYNRYASLYRILYNCVDEVTSMLKNIDKTLNKREAVAVNA